MRRRPSITDESVFLKWINLELERINEGVVAERKALITLIKEKNPISKTRGGKEYLFAKEVITLLQQRLPKELQNILKLPILFFFDADVKDSCYINDETAMKALHNLGELSHMRTMQNGKLWISTPIVYSLMKKYPTAIQIIMG